MSDMLDAALAYAARGWPVFPCSPQNKKPLVPKDRDAEGRPIRGTGGVSKATVDPELIRTWWGKWPRAMIGLSVGKAGFFVLDFDPRTDPQTGEDYTLDRLKPEVEAQIGRELPTSLAVRTPSGGVHVYFRQPADGPPITNRGNLPRHVDVRGIGGYVIAPPSFCEGDGKHARGLYRWLHGDAGAAIAEAPPELVDVLRAPAAAPAPAAPANPARAPASPALNIDDRISRFALKALDEECRELAETPIGGGRHGGRNNGIYWAAYNLGQLVGAGALSEFTVRAALQAVVHAMPDNRDLPGSLQTLENGLENGKAKPRDLSSVGQRQARSSTPSPRYAPPPPTESDYAIAPAPAPERDNYEADPPIWEATSPAAQLGGQGGRIRADRDDDLDRRCAFFPLTDLGNAERFRARFGWRFRFCKELGWFMWDGRRWALLSEEKDKVPGEVSLAVFETVRAIRNEADYVENSGEREDELIETAPEPDEDPQKGLDFIVRWKGSGDNKQPVYWSDMIRDHAKSSEGAQRLGCIANLCKAFGDISISADQMDADRMAINVLNGTLRLVIGAGGKHAIRRDDHNPRDLISKLANVVYDPRAACDVYDGFLATVQPDEAIRRFLHQWGGLSLTGDIGEQKLAFFHGKGRNGKSTLVDTWAAIAGDYGGSIAIETFLEQGRGRKGGDATPDLARLPGVRFLRTSEPEKGAKLAEALIKLVTGGEAIDARHLNKGFFTFLPSFKLTISGNHQPKITGHDDGIWRRVMLVPWSVQIPAEDVDRELPQKMKAEASGILNRLLAGLLDRMEHGLVEPDAVKEATRKYRERSDQLGRFLADCTRQKEGAHAQSAPLFALFTAWSRATGGAEWQQVGFSKAMEDRGFEKKKSNGMQWVGIEMIKTPEDFSDADAPHPDAGPPTDRWQEEELP